MTENLDSLIDDVRGALARKASAGNGSLQSQLRRADRLLSRDARKAGKVLLEAEKIAGNPKMRFQTDMKAARRAAKRLLAHLDTLDPWDRRKGQILGFLGAVSGGILLLLGVTVVVLHWRGFV